CRAYNTGDISIVQSDAEKLLTFDSEDYDTDTYHSTSSNTGRLTVPTTGYYHIEAMLQFSYALASGSTFALLSLFKNGTTLLGRTQGPFFSGPTGGYWQTVKSGVFSLTASDYVTLTVQIQGAASTVKVLGSTTLGNFTITSGTTGWGHESAFSI